MMGLLIDTPNLSGTAGITLVLSVGFMFVCGRNSPTWVPSVVKLGKRKIDLGLYLSGDIRCPATVVFLQSRSHLSLFIFWSFHLVAS